MRAMVFAGALGVVTALRPTWGDTPAPGWEVRVPDRLEVELGGTVKVPISIAVDRGLSVSKDGPLLIDISADRGLHIRKRRLLRADAVDPGADVPRFEIPVRGDAAGDHPVRVRIRLWLCGGKVCRPLDLTRQTAITVHAPPAGSQSPDSPSS